MLDDVVGLTMVQVIPNLGRSGSPFRSIIVIRPVLVSIGLVLVILLLACYLIKPLTVWLDSKRQESPLGIAQRILSRRETILLFHTAILIALVISATYAGTSNLFAAYLAGVSISWWDHEIPHSTAKAGPSTVEVATRESERPAKDSKMQHTPDALEAVGLQHLGTAEKEIQQIQQESLEDSASKQIPLSGCAGSTGTDIYDLFYASVVKRILKPFFFVSTWSISLNVSTSKCL